MTDATNTLAVGLDREAVAGIVREMSKGRCEVFAYHKAYAVTERAALEIADAILALALAAPAEGYVLVPVERLQKIADGCPDTRAVHRVTEMRSIARAMIAAALPAAPTGETGA